jgi:shikimate kinase
VLARLLEAGPQVLATGGGAFMRDETRQRIAARGISIWLRADADTILKRVKRRGGRPLLQADDPAEVIGRLLAERDPVYAQADIVIESRDVAHELIVEECVAALRARLDGEAAPAAGDHSVI